MRFIVNNYDKIKSIVLVLLIASLPFQYFISNVLIGLGAFLTIYSAFYLRRWPGPILNTLSVTLICYFLLEVIGLVYTDRANLSIGLFLLEKHQAMIMISLIFVDFKIESKNREVLFVVFVASCFVASLICVVSNMYESLKLYDMYFHPWIFSHDRMSEPIGLQAVYFALYLCFTLLILLSELRQRFDLISPVKRILCIFLIIYFFAFVIALGARTAIVALMLIIISNLVYSAISLKSYRLFLVVAIVPVIFSGFIFLNPIVKTRFMDMLKSSYEESDYGSYFARSQIWLPGLEAIGENIWFGVGTGDEQQELDKKFIEYNYTEGIQTFNMHNQYLQTLLGFGIIGLFLFLAILFVQIKAAIEKKNQLYLSFLLLFVCACLTESMLNRNKGIIFFLVFSFVFYNSESTSKNKNLTI